jgi:phage-related holin
MVIKKDTLRRLIEIKYVRGKAVKSPKSLILLTDVVAIEYSQRITEITTIEKVNRQSAFLTKLKKLVLEKLIIVSPFNNSF